MAEAMHGVQRIPALQRNVQCAAVSADGLQRPVGPTFLGSKVCVVLAESAMYTSHFIDRCRIAIGVCRRYARLIEICTPPRRDHGDHARTMACLVTAEVVAAAGME